MQAAPWSSTLTIHYELRQDVRGVLEDPAGDGMLTRDALGYTEVRLKGNLERARQGDHGLHRRLCGTI